MKYCVVALRDEVAKEYCEPHIERSEAFAIRNIETVVMSQKAKEEGLFFSHPHDYSLYKIGEYDSEVGVIASCTPVMLRKCGEI